MFVLKHQESSWSTSLKRRIYYSVILFNDEFFVTNWMNNVRYIIHCILISCIKLGMNGRLMKNSKTLSFYVCSSLVFADFENNHYHASLKIPFEWTRYIHTLEEMKPRIH